MAHVPRPSEGGFTHSSYDDPAFDPQPCYGFDDTNDLQMRALQDHVAPMDFSRSGAAPGFASADGQSHDLSSYAPFSMGSGAFAPGLTSSMDPTKMYGSSQATLDTSQGQAGPAPPPQSRQSVIVQNRADSVAEKHGQVTPPDQTPPEAGDSQSSHSADVGHTVKLNKSERARNAANQRHAKTKLAREGRGARKDAGLSAGSEGSEEEVEDKREKYREKNRLAAAKCRAKKKENTEGLEDKHRNLNASNNWLKRVERELRDELSALRTCALQHTPAIQDCRCGQLHEYNRRKADQVAYGLGGPAVSSPSDGGLSNMGSPGMRHIMTGAGQLTSGPQDQMMHMFGGPQAFLGQSHDHLAFGGAQMSGSMGQSMTVTSEDGVPSFTNFMEPSQGVSGFP